MFLRMRSFTVLAGLVAFAGVAYGDAYATGQSSVGAFLFNVGDNNNGGTGLQIGESLFSVYNSNFMVGFSGPGSETQFVGNGIIDGGFDAGTGLGWSYFGENNTSGDISTNDGFSDASNVVGSVNLATEDTYNELIYKITNNSSSTNEWFDLQVADGVTAEVDLDNSTNEFGQDEALQEFGYSNSQGSFTGNTSSNEAYAFTGDGFGENDGTDTFDFVSNSITDYYTARLKPGQTVYFAIVTENYSQVGAAVTTPSPAAVIPFALGLLGARRRRKTS
jgi:hypothetical protein